MAQKSRPTRIVILGGGFAGAYCAQALQRRARRENLQVTLVDRRNYFIFYPLLVEAGIGSLEPRHAVVPLHMYLPKTSFVMAGLRGIDRERREVVCRLVGTELEKRLPYDHLVLALGSVTRLAPVPGLREYGLLLKTIGDSVGLRDRVIQLLEIANNVEEPAARAEWLNMVVVGGSYTGVEVAGEFQAYMAEATRHYANLSPRDIQVTLVEMQDRILPALEGGLGDYAREHMERNGVRFRLGNSIRAIEPRRVVLDDGETIPTRTVVWCAGIAPHPILRDMPIPVDEMGRVRTEDDLRVEGAEDIWALGDCARVLDGDGNPYAPTAQNATREARIAADNIIRAIRGGETQPCRIRPLGSLASIGCRSAVAKLPGLRLSGFPAWFLWRSVYLFKMPTLTRKLRVALDWTADLLFSRDIVQLGVHQLRRAEDKTTPPPTPPGENGTSSLREKGEKSGVP